MIPQQNDIVVLFFRSGASLEGSVISWSDQKSVLSSLQGAATIVIQKTLDDVMFYKIKPSKTDYEELAKTPIKNDNDIRRLADLKIELNELEKEEIREKLKSHEPNALRQVSYELPRNIKIKSAVNNSAEEATRADTGFGSELQDLFSKKY